MASGDVTDPAHRLTPIPAEGDGEELIGEIIDGRYRLDATLGRGGMGLVFRAHHVGLRRQVAVKILHPSLAASPDVRNRFEREALAVGRIDHPNCVSVYDVGRLPDGSLYLAMELLDGKSLADVLEQQGQIAPGRALHILAHILRGLGHIHQAGLIHRDIKPENIFLIRQGEDLDFAKILDFGIAKPMEASELDDGVKLTQAGMAFGTPIYMAPEQALGNPMDGRADLYAAAVLGYEMLTGQPPFYSDDKLEVMSMHTARPVPPMRQRLIKGGRPVPASIERLIARGLTKKPAERYASAEVFLAEVEAALHTPDGGATAVELEAPHTDTGSQPLVTDDGKVELETVDQPSEAIAAAIEEELAQPKPPRLATPPLRAGLGAGPPRSRTTGAVGAPARGPTGASGVAGPPGADLPQGGVGLGLPYTGPSGEPIFGLTPEQRIAQAATGTADPAGRAGLPEPEHSGIANAIEPSSSGLRPLSGSSSASSARKKLLYGGIALVAVIAGVTIAVVTSGSDGPVIGEIDPSSPAGQAMAALERGDPERAIEHIEAAGDSTASDPMAQLVLGHARAALHDSEPALDAYQRALELLPQLEANPRLRADLRTMAADRDPSIVSAAFELWVGRTKDPEATPLLLKAAVSDNTKRRHGVRDVIERLELADQVDWLASYSLDLEQLPKCEQRQEAVAKLRALNDPRAVPPLERAIAKKARRRPYSPCLLDDARAAIGYLKGLAEKQ